MRSPVDKARLQRFMRELDRAVTGPGRVYLCGGTTALLMGWRDSTVDVDLQFDPEPGRIYEAISELKRRLDMNIEVAGPADFVPALPGWRDRCIFIEEGRHIAFFHYDPYTQALSKLTRGHRRDLDDVDAMVRGGDVDPAILAPLFEQVRAGLIRYPHLDADALQARIKEWVDAHHAA